MTKFNEWLRKTRIQRNLSQRALSKKLNVEQATISNWERGNTQPTPDSIARLATVFDTSAETITTMIRPVTTLSLIAWPVSNIKFRSCEKCVYLSICAQDVADDLPAWCETPDEEDVIVAECAGRLSRLQARYTQEVTI